MAELLQAKSDLAAWQTVSGQLVATIGQLQAVARGEDKAKCQAALAALDKQLENSALREEPAGKSIPLPNSPTIRSLMATMDGINADAKIAVMTGNVAAAKNQAFVLAELSKLVFNTRSGEKWTSLCADFEKASLAVATSTDTDPKNVRQLLRGISQQCEICHESSRTR